MFSMVIMGSMEHLFCNCLWAVNNLELEAVRLVVVPPMIVPDLTVNHEPAIPKNILVKYPCFVSFIWSYAILRDTPIFKVNLQHSKYISRILR